MIDVNGNEWRDYKKHVLHELARLATTQEQIRAEIVSLREGVAGLRVRVALLGGGAGLLVSIIAEWLMRSLL